MDVDVAHWTNGDEGAVRRLAALDSDQTLVLVFGASNLVDNPRPLETLRAAMPDSVFVGCSSSGHVCDDELHDDGLCAAAIRFRHTTIRLASALISDSAESLNAGRTIGEALSAPDLRGVLLYSEGLRVNGSELARGLMSAVPESVPATGGLAGDGDRFERTWVCAGRDIGDGRAAAVGLYGDRVQVGHGSMGGWDAFGPMRRVTRAKGNVLYELDATPALDVYKRYLGERAKELPASALLFPLALRDHPDAEQIIVRTILSVDEASQSMVFAGDVPEGACAQLMRANFDRLIQGAYESSRLAAPGDVNGDTVLSIAISCVGRRLVLGARTEEELDAALDALPKGARQIGFYSYGELSPLVHGSCDLHNQTMTMTTIREQ